MKKLFILYILLPYTICFGQTAPQIVPLSPEASSLFKFMDVPVSLYAGTQNTSIPLLEIKTGGLSIPISLSYSSRGVLVSELSSRVGNGWSLNYGGMISRQIRSKADEKPFGYNSDINSLPIFYSDSFARSNYFIMEAVYENSHDYYQGIDYYPDKFMINSNFYNGEFFFDKHNNLDIVTQKYSDIKIHSHSVGYYGYETFTVTDNMGNEYSFGGAQTISTNPTANEYDLVETGFNVPFGGDVYYDDNPNGDISYNTFNLREIITPTKKKINYTYEEETVKLVRRTGDIQNQYSEGYQVGEPMYICKFAVAYSHQKVLKEIKYEEGTVKFIKSSDERQDLKKGHALDRIEQYNVKNELIKLIKFNYVYNVGFEDGNINSYLKIADNTATKRLFLESIVFKDLLTTKEEKYSFEYDGQELPSRHSNSIDAWGYFNGKDRGEYLIFDDVPTKTGVDPVKMQAGILKKVTYPTGGSTVFEYEPNIVNNELPDRIEIAYPNKADLNVVTLSTIEPTTYNYGYRQYEKPFTVTNAIGHKAKVSVQIPDALICKLVKISTNPTTQFLTAGVNYDIPIGEGNYKLIVDPRDSNWKPYRDSINYPDPETDPLLFNSFNISLRYYNSEYDYDKIIYGPGNRIKKITNFSAADKEEFSRVYEYLNDFNTLSGYLFSVSNFKVHEYPTDSNNPLANGSYFHTPNLPGGKWSSYINDNFGYTQVNEYLTDKSGSINDKTSHYYSLLPDLGSYYLFPLHPVASNEWIRGKELLTRFYKKENNVFKKIREIQNEYLLYGTVSILYPTYPLMHPAEFYFPSGFIEIEKLEDINTDPDPYVRDRMKFCYPNSTGCGIYINDLNPNDTTDYVNFTPHQGYRTSFFTGGTFDLSNTKVTDYFDNDRELVTTTNYAYRYSDHYNLASTTQSTSTGSILKKFYYYANDPEMANEPAVQQLIDNNMVGIPLQTETKNGATGLVATEKTVYRDWGTSNNTLLLPEIIKTSKGNANAEEVIKYTSYDDKGNPLEVERKDGMKVSYIWGYNNTQPVAKLENISYANIPSELITAIQNSTNPDYPSITETQVFAALDALRTSADINLQKAMITTYTYKLLVGVTSITDPKGLKTTYKYDGFGRLSSVIDASGNVLSENEYHYRTQN